MSENLKYIKFIFVLIFFQTIVLIPVTKAQNLFTEKDKGILLSEHNFLRKIVGAKDFIWSKDLEQKALTLANNIAQNPISYTKDYNYGINLFRSANKPNPKQIVKTWSEEQIYYKGKPISQKGLFIYQHYTQIIWKQTISVGCAMRRTKGGTYIVACFYNPKGNTIGEKP